MQNDAQPVDERPPSEGGVSAQMRQDLALHFADQFRIGVERSNTLLGAWVSALMLILFASILPVAGKLDRIEKAKVRAAKAWTQLQHLNRQSDTVRNRIVNRGSTGATALDTFRMTAMGHNDTVRLRALEADIARLRSDTAAARRGIDSIAHDIAHIPTPIGTLPVSYYYLAVIWIVLLIVLLTLFLYKRVLLVSLLVRTVTIDPEGALVLPGRGAWAPFWLAPLPRLERRGDGAAPTEGQIRRFLGWRGEERWRGRLLYVALALLLVAYSGVAYLAVRVSGVDYPIPRIEAPAAVAKGGVKMAEAERARQISISSYDPQASVSMTVLVSVLLIVVLVLYINILHVPLHVGGYPERVISVSRRRRRFLHAAAWGIGIGIAYTLVPRRFPFHYLAVGKPRFRREESVGQMEHLARLFAGKFELHKRSRALHYVNRAGWVIGGVAPSAANMTLLDLAAVAALLQAPPAADEPFKRGPVALLPLADTLAGKKGEAEEEEKPAERSRRRRLRHAAPHVPAARRGPLAEYAALMLVHGGDIPGGIKVLWGAIEHDTIYKKGRGGRPDRRLYELLAGLAVRSSSSADLLRLDDHVGAHWRDDELDIRRTVWCAPASRWRSRWTGKGFPWKPPHEKGERRGAA